MGVDGDFVNEGDSSVSSNNTVTVHIRCSNNSKFSIQTGLDVTIRVFKAILAENCDVPAEQQRLIYKGGILKDEQTMESYAYWDDIGLAANTVVQARDLSLGRFFSSILPGNSFAANDMFGFDLFRKGKVC